MLDTAKLMRAQELVRRAKALGVDLEQYAGNTDALGAALDAKEAELGQMPWEVKVDRWCERRRMLAAAYIAGASLRQLGRFERIQASSVKELVWKEMPFELARKIGHARTGGTREFGDEKVEVMLNWFKQNRIELGGITVIVIAAKMRQAAIEADETSL